MNYNPENYVEISPRNVIQGDIIRIVKLYPPPNIKWMVTLRVTSHDFGREILYGNVLEVAERDSQTSDIPKVQEYKVCYGDRCKRDANWGERKYLKCPAIIAELYKATA